MSIPPRLQMMTCGAERIIRADHTGPTEIEVEIGRSVRVAGVYPEKQIPRRPGQRRVSYAHANHRIAAVRRDTERAGSPADAGCRFDERADDQNPVSDIRRRVLHREPDAERR